MSEKNKKIIWLNCYNAVLTVKTNNYSIDTFKIFTQLVADDFKIDAEKMFVFFNENRENLKNEKNVLQEFFKINDLKIGDITELIYKLRVADRNEIRINHRLKEKLDELKKIYALNLYCNAIKEITDRELSYFKLQRYFDEIKYSDIFFCNEIDLKKIKTVKKSIVLKTEEELYNYI